MDRNSEPFIGLDKANSFSHESSSADIPPSSCSESESFDLVFTCVGPTTFEDGLEITIPLEAVVHGGNINLAPEFTIEPDRECCLL